jgi:hypothetical protein
LLRPADPHGEKVRRAFYEYGTVETFPEVVDKSGLPRARWPDEA